MKATNADGSNISIKASLEILQDNGKRIIMDFKKDICPEIDGNHDWMKAFSQSVDLKVTVLVKDLNGNVLKTEVFYDLDLVCTSNGACGFVNT